MLYLYAMTQPEVIQKILNLAASQYPDAEMYLYGSRARKEAGPLSDWDLLVLLSIERVSFALETTMMDAFYEIELQTGEVISPLIYPKSIWITQYCQTPLYENIKREGIRLR